MAEGREEEWMDACLDGWMMYMAPGGRHKMGDFAPGFVTYFLDGSRWHLSIYLLL